MQRLTPRRAAQPRSDGRRAPLLRALGLALVLAGAAACGAPEQEPATTRADQGAADAETASAASDGPRGLIPRKLFFAAPERYRGRLSPDGRKVTWLAAHEGAVNLWIATAWLGEGGARMKPDSGRPLTSFSSDVSLYWWMPNNTHLIVLSPREESKRVYALDVTTGELRDITPGDAASQAAYVGWSWDRPDEVALLELPPDQDAAGALYHVNVVTGEARKADANAQKFDFYKIDHALDARLAINHRGDGGKKIWARHGQGAGGKWELLFQLEPEDAASWRLIDFDGSNSGVFVLDSRDADAAMLARIDLKTGAREVIGGQRGADVSEVMVHPTTFEVEAFRVDRLTSHWIPLTASAARALETLEDQLDGAFEVLARTVDNQRWIIFEENAAQRGRYHVFEPETGEVKLLFDIQPALSKYLLAPKTAAVIPTSDGLELIAYVTLPAGADVDGDGRPERASPLVIVPSSSHRLDDGFDATTQFLADRGYAVLNVNVRGAFGLGKRFRNAAVGPDGEDAVSDVRTAYDWALAQGVATPGQAAIAGGYGNGDLVLRTAAAHADAFECAVAELPHAASQDKAASEPSVRVMSPQAELLGVPVLIGLGSSPEALEATRESAAAMRARGAETTIIAFKGTSEWFHSSADHMVWAAAMEQFLAGCLGGDAQPFSGVPDGARVEVFSTDPSFDVFASPPSLAPGEPVAPTR